MSKQFTVTELRCLELSRIIREGLPGVKFDMEVFWAECGTAACIAGYAVAKYDHNLWKSGDDKEIECRAKNLLGLSLGQSLELFWGHYDVTPAMAAATLENYAMTGKVEWPAS